MAFVSQAVSSYDAVTRQRAGDTSSQQVAFRHFNNFVKKELIQAALDICRQNFPETIGITVLDIGSGRGGDIGKWLFSQSPALSASTRGLKREQVLMASRYVCYDVSPECIEEAERRFRSFTANPCTASFSVADCYNESFGETLTSAQLVGQVHVVSIQFAFHYACASLESIATTLRHVAMCLRSGGIFIGTTVDSESLSLAVRSGHGENGLYAIEMLSAIAAPSEGETEDSAKTAPLPIGTSYNFRLDGFVDCPEYVVPMEDVKRIAADLGLTWVPEHSLTFPEMLSFYAANPKKNKGNTLSAAEVELVSLYRCFCFIKK